jgi:hypothetical protein
MAESPTNHDERDAQLRRSMLNIARQNGNIYQDGFVPFALFAGSSCRDRDGVPVEGEEHAARLLVHLLDKGYLEESRTIGLDQAPKANRHRRFKFTNFAFEWWRQNKSVPIDPMVDDDRLEAR